MKPVPDSTRHKARTPQEAKDRYRLFIQRTVTCVRENAIFYVGQSPEASANFVSLEPIERPIPLHTRNGSELYLEFQQSGEIVSDHRFRKEYRISTRSYHYAVKRSPEREADPLIMWHWHPGSTPAHPEPHIHAAMGDPMGLGRKLHIPTGARVTIEEVLTFLIREWDVAAVDGWEEVIADSQRRFEKYQVQDARRR